MGAGGDQGERPSLDLFGYDRNSTGCMAVMKTDDLTEKRQYPRACFDWPVTLISDQGTTIVGQVKNISRGGVLVHTGTELQIDEQVRLAIEISDFDDVISARGKVVRTLLLDEQSSSPTYAVGICFSEMSAEDYRYFTGNIASEWEENHLISEEKQETFHTGKKRYILPAIFFAVLIFIVFTQKYINDSKLTQVESSAQSYQQETEPIKTESVTHVKINDLTISNNAKMLQKMYGSAE